MKRLCVLLELAVLTFAFAPMESAALTSLFVATNLNGDGSSWATATNSIQGAISAIDQTNPTNTVWVSNGVYEAGGVTNWPSGTVLTNRIAITNAITVRSANNNPSNTIIKGAWDSASTTNGPAAVRCVYMASGSSLIGFTLTNGATLAVNQPSTGTNHNHYGGGVWCQSTAMVISNCMIISNSAGWWGGGAYYGTLFNCTVVGNYAGYGGGGTYATIMSNCTVVGNCGRTSAGGAYYGSLYNCTIVSNYAGSDGGGVEYSALYNCRLIGNTAGWGGGAVYHGDQPVYNCLIIGSRAQQGGGVRGGRLYNCTIVGNYASTYGGGVWSNKVNNCIVYFNDAPTGSNYYDIIGITNSCTTPLAGIGVNNIASDPMLIDKGSNYGTNHVAGNYRLNANSPCINTGTNGSWTTDYPYDLDGRTRIRYGTVDMGAYERINSGTIYGFH